MRRRYRPHARIAPTADKRDPLARLAAVVAEPNRDRAHRMFSRIRDEVEQAPAPWIAAARALHASGVISIDMYWYLATLFAEAILAVMHDVDPELVRCSNAMVAIEAAHGLAEYESFRVSEAPADWRALAEAWDRRSLALQVEYLRAHDVGDVADAMEHEDPLLDQRSEAGRREFWPDLDEPSLEDD